MTVRQQPPNLRRSLLECWARLLHHLLSPLTAREIGEHWTLDTACVDMTAAAHFEHKDKRGCVKTRYSCGWDESDANTSSIQYKFAILVSDSGF